MGFPHDVGSREPSAQGNFCPEGIAFGPILQQRPFKDKTDPPFAEDGEAGGVLRVRVPWGQNGRARVRGLPTLVAWNRLWSGRTRWCPAHLGAPALGLYAGPEVFARAPSPGVPQFPLRPSLGRRARSGGAMTLELTYWEAHTRCVHGLGEVRASDRGARRDRSRAPAG